MVRTFRAASCWLLDAALVFVLAAVLIWPLFRLNYSDKWASIEATFIADARFLKDHWPHPLWQPLWYTGTRFDYVYPPALRYGTAVQMKLRPGMSPARAYHLYIAFFYCLGIAGVYVLSRMGSRSRKFAMIAALMTATVSPSFLLINEIRQDARGSWSEPQRLGVLIRYGEGPHMTAVALLGFAMAFAIPALRSGGPSAIAAAAVACALVVSNNFYGATALAMLFPLLLWSWWVTHLDNRIFRRAIAIMVLSYGLCAFWLVPSYLTVTLDNMRFVSERGNRWSLWLTAGLAILYMKLTERWARGKTERAYSVFLIGALGFFFLNVIGNYYLKFRVIGEPFRMVPELDLLIILAGVEILRRLWEGELGFAFFRSRRFQLPRRALATVLVFLVFYSVRKYITGGWHVFVPDNNVQARLEYQITDWLHRNMPDARSYTTGTVRFWFNAWYDLAELGGGSEQGLLNPIVQPATWQLGMSEDGEYGMYWMQCTATDAAIVHDERSQEHYHDVAKPKKFAAYMPAVYDDGAGNLVYQVPRRYRGLARVVDSGKLDALPPLPEDPDKGQLKAFAELLERGPEAPVRTRWESTEKLVIDARVGGGQTVFVHIAHDEPWRAYANGKPLSLRKSQLGFMRIEAPPGDQRIELIFHLPWENIIGRGITLVTLAGVIYLFWRGRRIA